MSADIKSKVPNYALMIYDKPKQRFRLVPVETHVKFEKSKAKSASAQLPLPEVSAEVTRKQPAQKSKQWFAQRLKNASKGLNENSLLNFVAVQTATQVEPNQSKKH